MIVEGGSKAPCKTPLTADAKVGREDTSWTADTDKSLTATGGLAAPGSRIQSKSRRRFFFLSLLKCFSCRRFALNLPAVLLFMLRTFCQAHDARCTTTNRLRFIKTSPPLQAGKDTQEHHKLCRYVFELSRKLSLQGKTLSR